MNNKLIELFSSLTRKELKGLEEFIKSPFFNKSPKVLSLFYQIKKLYPKIDFSGMQKKIIFRHLYPGDKFKPMKLELIISHLVRLTEKFLTFKYFEEDKDSSQLILLKTLRTKDLHKNFRTATKKYLNILKNRVVQDTNDYIIKSQVENEIINSELYNVFLSDDLSFQKVIDNFDYYIAASKLNQAVFIFNHMNQVGTELKYNLWLLNETLTFIKSKLDIIEKDHPLLYCYYMLVLLLTESENEKNFFILKKYIKERERTFKDTFLWEILIEMNNYCDNKIKTNRDKYIKEILEIYKSLEIKNFFKRQIVINHIDFLNVVTVGLALKKLKWVSEFMAKYENKLPREFKYDTINLVKAEISFSRGYFEIALTSLSKIKYENYYFYLRIKILQAKIFYEKKEIETLYYTLDALKHYIRRNKKLLKRYEKVTLNFIHYIYFIVKHDNLNKEQLLTMKKRICEETELTSKEWIIRKYEEQISLLHKDLYPLKFCSKVP